MAVPKSFTGGERLFAEDLNDNFSALDAALGQVGPEFSIASSDSIAMVFDKDRLLATLPEA